MNDADRTVSILFRPRAGLILTLALLMGLVVVPTPAQHGSGEGHGHDATMRHEFKNAEQWVERFESPDRWDWQKPLVVLQVLALTRGQVVADIGAGTGYFTWRLAAWVGTAGKVYAVDIEPEMLQFIDSRPDFERFHNIETVLAAPDDPKLPPARVDVALVVNTWHHIDGRLGYLERLRKSLRPGGRVAIVDWREGDLPQGPPAGSKLSREAVLQEFAEAGWLLVAESRALPYQYMLVFMPRS